MLSRGKKSALRRCQGELQCMQVWSQGHQQSMILFDTTKMSKAKSKAKKLIQIGKSTLHQREHLHLQK